MTISKLDKNELLPSPNEIKWIYERTRMFHERSLQTTFVKFMYRINIYVLKYYERDAKALRKKIKHTLPLSYHFRTFG